MADRGRASRTSKSDRAEDAVKDLHEHPAFRAAARGGFAVNGLLHILIGALALAIVGGGGGDEADQGGALRSIAESPGGIVVLVVLLIGLAALGVWLCLEAFLENRPRRTPDERWAKTALTLAKGLVYLALCVPVVTVLLGVSSESDEDVQEVSTFLLQTPGGIIVLIAGAVALLGIGGYFVVKGARRRFLDDIRLPRSPLDRAVTALGIAGYTAKGVALAAVGGLLATAAISTDASEAGGIDDALRAIAGLPFGQVLLAIVGGGLIAYGIYCFARARLATL
ncbi:DUF1206 domain-containing protein [Microcella daejeonensis]|uniref:DUF1206 domain-containing protein n=1 Tax=Microcella daejeonensis TaxID=2994971 RepID=UPI00226EE14C|nr:DUF1206 domain-containing protein [Microcella daejeonensis]WAB83452.1 DUF1206 domain-containing protein [Microcella daejeonensis]